MVFATFWSENRSRLCPFWSGIGLRGNYGSIYTLFDGLAYNTCGYFASCVVFPNPAGARKNTSNEQSVRSYYMLNHRIRGLLFHYKKKNYLAIGFYFFVRVFRDILILSVRMTLTISKMFARIICQPLNERLIILLQKKTGILASIL